MKQYIAEFKIQNLILSISGLVLGALLSAADYNVNWWSLLFLVASVLSLQVFTTVIPGIIFAVASVWMSYGTVLCLDSLITLLLGYFVYRMVRNHSLSSAFFRNGIVVILTSLVIFGLLPVYGVYFVSAHSFGNVILLLPSISIGSLSLAVVNAGALVDRKDKFIHSFWIMFGISAMLAFASMRIFDPLHFIFVLLVPIFVLWLYRMWTGSNKMKSYEILLPFLILTFAVLTGLGFVAYLI